MRREQTEVQTGFTARKVSPPLSLRTPRTISPQASAHLDFIRAFAAWAVMWGHLRALFFVNYQQLPSRSVFLKVLYFMTGFGHQAVMVFFVLSGFLISSTVIKNFLSAKWSWREYAVNRSVRLYVVLIPGLLLGLLWDSAGSHWFASTGLYTHPLVDLGPEIAKDNLTAGNFFGNLFYLQTILCRTFGSNAPLWSLSNEFWYYVLFPLTLTAAISWTRKSLRAAIPLSFLAVGLAIFLGTSKLLGFLVWMAGCALAIAYSRWQIVAKKWQMTGIVLSLFAVSACLSVVRLGQLVDVQGDLMLGSAFSVFLYFVLQVKAGGSHFSYRKWAHLFAGFSYSLYVLHLPFLLFAKAWIVGGERWLPDALHLMMGFFVGVVTLGFAWFISVFTENKTSAMRNWVGSMVGTSR